MITNYLHLIQQDSLKESHHGSEKSADGFSVPGFGVARANIKGHGQHATVAFDETIDIELEVDLGDGISHPVLIMDVIDGKGLQLTGKRIPVPAGPGSKVLSLSMKCSFHQMPRWHAGRALLCWPGSRQNREQRIHRLIFPIHDVILSNYPAESDANSS